MNRFYSPDGQPTVEGPHSVRATVLRHSISDLGIPLVSWEAEYPRIVLAELNTHGQVAKNSASSRAIPFAKMVEQLKGRPVRFGANQSGMQDKGEDHDTSVIIPPHLHQAFAAYLHQEFAGSSVSLSTFTHDDGSVKATAFCAWDFHKFLSVGLAGALNDAKYHKQVFNRLTEAHQMMKTVITMTECPNFFWLRNDGAADPTLHALAHVMRESLRMSKPDRLRAGDWHLPYVEYFREHTGEEGDDAWGPQQFYIGNPITGESYEPLTVEQAIRVSAARSAAVSFRNEDYGVEKSNEVHGKLVGDARKHASAMEHQATPILPTSHDLNNPAVPATWQPGVSHMSRDGALWSGRFRGWVQYRKTIPGENYTGEF